MLVTVFRRATLARRLASLWPPEARRQGGALKAEIRRLIDSPDEPCIVGDVWVQNGRGRHESLQQQIFGCEVF